MRAFGNDALQERRRHELDAEKREEQMQGLELRQRRREFEEKLRAMHAVELEESKKEETDMQALVLGMEVTRWCSAVGHLSTSYAGGASE